MCVCVCVCVCARARARDITATVVKMMEEAEARGQVDLHGYAAKDAISGVDLILDLLQHAASANAGKATY